MALADDPRARIPPEFAVTANDSNFFRLHSPRPNYPLNEAFFNRLLRGSIWKPWLAIRMSNNCGWRTILSITTTPSMSAGLTVAPSAFPFHLDQIIINGRRFFEMTAHYQQTVAQFNERSAPSAPFLENEKLDGFVGRIMETINTYKGQNRTGDRYVRTIFDCLLIYYIDKFGHVEISRAIEKIFVWAYSLRLKMQVVQFASMDNHVLEHNLFRAINEATRPGDFINCSLPVLTARRSTKTEEMEEPASGHAIL